MSVYNTKKRRVVKSSKRVSPASCMLKIDADESDGEEEISATDSDVVRRCDEGGVVRWSWYLDSISNENHVI